MEKVKDFDLQLFADEAEPEVKIKVGDKEYTQKELEEAIDIKVNVHNFNKSNTEKAQQIAEERKQVEEERKQTAGQLKFIEEWSPIANYYQTNEDFQKIFTKVLDPDDVKFQQQLRQMVGIEPVSGDDDSVMFEDEPTKQLKQTITQQNKVIQSQGQKIDYLFRDHQARIEKLVVEDKNKVVTSIIQEQDPFTIEQLETFINEKATQGISLKYSDAYELMRLQHKDEYLERDKKKIEDEVKKKYEQTKPPNAPVSGAGVTAQEKGFTTFDNATADMKKTGGFWK